MLPKFPRLMSLKSVFWPAFIGVALLQLGCATPPAENNSVARLSAEECEGFEALLIDPAFDTVSQQGSAWRLRQHAGDTSFAVTAADGQLNFERIGKEPWATYTQKITDARLRGRVVRYSADLQGDISDEVTHAFGAKSGLFLRVGPRPDANMADHEPNVGQWDRQRVALEATVPEAFDYVEVGFIYQGGEGVLSAIAPKLELWDCSP